MPARTDPKKSLEPAMSRLEKYTLFETSTYYYLVGSDARERHYKVLKLDRCAAQPCSLDDVIMEDPNMYDKQEMLNMLNMISEGNKTTGGLTQVTVAYGLVGFVRFLDCFYFTLITQRKKVGSIGNNDIYAIKSAEVFAIRPKEQMQFSLKNVWNSMKGKINRATVDTAESRYLGLFQFIDISKDFFFSYTYDLTHTLQFNLNLADKSFPPPPCEEIFEWSRHQSEELRGCLGDLSSAYWVLPIIHGSFQQRRFDMFGKMFDIALIARRSRHYAGTRYLKRGISVHGKVANDCEMEQIIQLPEGRKFTFASYVQVRGSIPTYWFQETSVTMPKPPILVNRIDPTYLATQIHFADLFSRYGSPIIVLDLVKQSEKRKRECIIGKEFRQAVEIVNANLTDAKKIRYLGLDFSRMSKAAKHVSASVNSRRRGSAVVMGAGSEWSNFENAMGNEVLSAAPTTDAYSLVTPQSPLSAMTAESNEISVEARVDVLRELKVAAAWTLAETAFFCNSSAYLDNIAGHVSAQSRNMAKEAGLLQQSGVLRTNCIDCLDRTNVAQFAAGACFLNVGLTALGLMLSPRDEPSSGVLLGLMDLYSEMGDKIALQYGGSNAHKKVSGGGKGIAQAGKSGSKPNELLTSIKRYYSNAFTDRLKQDAMNLFLGYFIPSQSDSPLWDLENDYYMHNRVLRPEQPISDKMLYDLNSFVRQHYGRGGFRDSIVVNCRRSKKLIDGLACKSSSSDNLAVIGLPVDGLEDEFIDANYVEQELENIMEHFDQIVGSYLIKEESSMGRKRASSVKYLNEQTIDNMSMAEKAAVRRLERRKLVLKQKQVMLDEAYRIWWKEAIQKYHSKLQWMCLTPPEPSLVAPYFDRTHDTSVLTSFDEKLAEDYFSPFDATVAGPIEEPNISNAAQQGQQRAMSTAVENLRQDSILATLGGPLKADSNSNHQDAGNDFQFSLSKFVLDIGKQATKAVVDGIMRRNDDEEFYRNKQERENLRRKVEQSKNKKKYRDVTPHWKDVEGDPDSQKSLRSLIDLPISDESMRIYLDCENKFSCPEEFIHMKSGVRRKDFEQLLRPVMLSENDVYGMENLARDSIVCDVIKDGLYLGMSRTDTAIGAYERVFTNLVFVENEITDLSTVTPISIKSRVSIAASLAEPVKFTGNYTDLIHNYLITSPTFGDDDAFNPLGVSDDTLKAARAAADFSKSLKNVGAAAMLGAATPDRSDVEISPEKFVSGPQNQVDATAHTSDFRDDCSDSDDDDDDEIIRIKDTRHDMSYSPEVAVSPPLPPVEALSPPGRTSSSRVTPFESGSPEEKDKREKLGNSVLAAQGCLIMNNFWKTPLFEESAIIDATLGEKAAVEMLDIPGPAKKVLTKIALATGLAPGLEEEIYKLIANYMFQNTMYSRNISFDRLSKRLSALTSQADLLHYSSFYALDELAANLDDIMFISSSENTGRFYELDNLRKALESRHAHYLREIEEFKLSSVGMADDNITAAINALANRKEELMRHSTALVEFLQRLQTEKFSDTEFKESSSFNREIFVCPDSFSEDYLSKFSQVQSDLYQKKDNEYVIANTVAMMSFYSFHNQGKIDFGVWS